MVTDKKLTLDALKAGLAAIKTKFPPPPVDQTYKYLKSLYLLREQIGNPRGGEILDYFKRRHEKLPQNVQKRFFRVMIQQTGDWILPQLKSRYANALEFVFTQGVPSKQFITFMKGKGGIKACDELHRKPSRARKHK